MMVRNRNREALTLSRRIVLCLMAGVAGCSGEGTDSPVAVPSDPQNSTSEYALQIHVKKDGQTHKIKIPPVKHTRRKGASRGPNNKTTATSPQLSPQAGFDTPDSGHVEIDSIETNSQNSWLPLAGAAAECGIYENSSNYLLAFDAWRSYIPPWDLGNFIFPSSPTSCDQILAEEEAMLCIASKLEEVADALGPVTWEKAEEIPVVYAGQTIRAPWTFPPQSANDRFILRDMAMHVLANIAWFDTVKVTIAETEKTCAQAYVYAYQNPAEFDYNAGGTVFQFLTSPSQKSYFPPNNYVTQDQVQEGASFRLRLNATILRESGRMLERLIARSVEADHASGMQRRARAADQAIGNERLWGVGDDDGYNSLAHAMRVLEGRLELGHSGMKPERACGNVYPSELMASAAPAEFTSRISDRAVESESQEKAIEIVASSGLVMNESEIVSGSARNYLTDQMVFKGAKTLAPATETVAEFRAGLLGQTIVETVNSITDEDLRFALRATAKEYRGIVSIDDSSSLDSPAIATLKAAPTDKASTLPSDTSVLLLKAGMPERDLMADATARTGGMQEASQCGDPSTEDAEPEWNVPLIATSDKYGDWPFQNVFALGQSLRRRLVSLRELGIPLDTSSSSVSAIAGAGAAEIGTWAGRGSVVVSATPKDSGAGISSLDVRLIGFTPEDLGVKTSDGMDEQIMAVWGPPWVAECAAKTRDACPDLFTDLYVASRPGVQEIRDLSQGKAAYFGADGYYLHLRFSTPFPSKFTPSFVSTSAPANDHLYIVQRTNPARPREGKVLAAVTLREESDYTGAPVSSARDDYTNGLIGVNKSIAIDGIGKRGRPGLADPRDYCLRGVPYDKFIPLENELTSDSDQFESSWRHYLTLAKQAAEKADELAEKMIDEGLKKDFRREGVNEELAQLCGSYGSLEDAWVSNGQVYSTPWSGDSVLSKCIAEDKVDYVFLTNRPRNADGTEKTDAEIRAELRTKYGFPSGPFTFGYLGIADAEPPPPADYTRCGDAASMVSGLRDGFDDKAAKTLVNESWLWPSAIELTTSFTKLIEDPVTLEWKLTSGGTVMDSRTDSGMWPGCRRPNASPCQSPAQGQPDINAVFDRAFRRNATPGEQLGTIDGSAPQELKLIRWRVEGALWTLGALVGGLPQGAFQRSIPVANFNAIGPDPADLRTIYGSGKVACNNACVVEDIGGEDNQILAPLQAISGNTAYPDSEELPALLKDVYASDGGSYYHTSAKSNTISLVNYGVDAAKWLNEQVAKLANLKCTDGTSILFSGDGSAASTAVANNLTQLKKSGSLPLCYWKQHPEHAIMWMESSPDGQSRAKLRDIVIGSPKDALVDALQVQVRCSLVLKGVFHVPESAPDFMSNANDPPDHDSWIGCPVTSEDNALPSPPMGGTGRNGPISPNDGQWIGLDPINDLIFRYAAYTHRWLLPHNCSPSGRLPAFVNSYAPRGECGAASQIGQAVTLQCALDGGNWLPSPTEPPPLTSMGDITALKRWIRAQSYRAGYVVSGLYLQGFPTSVIDDIKSEKVTPDNSTGERGRVLLQMGTSIREIVNNWQRVQMDLAQLASAIEVAEHRLLAANIEAQSEAERYAIARLQIHLQVVQAVASCIGYNAVVNPGSFMAAGQVLETASEEEAAYARLGELSDAGLANAQLQIFAELEHSTQPLYADLSTALRGVQSAVASTAELTSQLAQGEQKARYLVAKGLGEDYVREEDGTVVDLPVNTVLNRSYDITRMRYDRALDDAKYLAFVARLAIEQRIGARFNTLKEPVGPLEAPATWADDVCSLHGLDYARLRSRVGGDVSYYDTEFDAQSDIAKQYVGDYVNKLEQFVEFYNMEYPSHEGDDTAVVSLREDLVPAHGSCVRTSPNLLYYSDRLDLADAVQENGAARVRGWMSDACSDMGDKCLRVYPSDALPAPNANEPLTMNQPPQGNGGGGVTWLKETARLIYGDLDAGLGPETDSEASSPAPQVTPPRSVWQSVWLEPGRQYILSWWDQARDEAGHLLEGATPATLYVALYDSQWGHVSSATFVPYVVPLIEAPEGGTPDAAIPGERSPWLPPDKRSSMKVQVPAAGWYQIAFSVSLDKEARGSVAISNVQLEETSNSKPGVYIGTSATREYVGSGCADQSASEFQSAFTYGCEPNDGPCYYELAKPILVATHVLGTNKSPLNGKLAAGNFNYRHIDLAINLAGSGLIDCSQVGTASCYGTGYVEYTLSHDAYNAPVMNYTGGSQLFNFGSASLNHAKGLAAERFISVPLSSNDQGLISQPGITKSEFMGRPLDGRYRLRIWDRPGLMWNRLEDIQLVLKYRYWSKLQKQAGAN